MHAPLDGGDAVGVPVDALVVPGVPLERDVEHLAVVVFVFVVAHLGEQRVLRGVHVLDEVDEATLVLVGDLLFALGALVGEDDLEALVEERHRLEAFEHGASDELGALGLEDGRIGPERDGGAGGAAALGRVTDRLHLALWLAALRVLLEPVLAVAVDLDREPLGQGVDHRHTDTVETAGHLVALAAELAAGVEHGEHDLGRALALVLARLVRVDRDAATVVVDPAPTVGEQRDADAVAIARHRLVDRVVDHFPDQVMETLQAGGPDVHARTLADRIEALEDLDVLGAVAALRLVAGCWFGVSGHAVPQITSGSVRCVGRCVRPVVGASNTSSNSPQVTHV